MALLLLGRLLLLQPLGLGSLQFISEKQVLLLLGHLLQGEAPGAELLPLVVHDSVEEALVPLLTIQQLVDGPGLKLDQAAEVVHGVGQVVDVLPIAGRALALPFSTAPGGPDGARGLELALVAAQVAARVAGVEAGVGDGVGAAGGVVGDLGVGVGVAGGCGGGGWVVGVHEGGLSIV